METKTVISITLTVAERNTIKAAADIERRTISNFSMLAALDRAKAHGITPCFDNEEGYVKGE